MANYDQPKTPPSTPPAIDPDVDPKAASEMEKQSENEDGPLGDRTDQSEIATERPDDGAGDDSLEAMRSVTLLPPD